MKKIILYISLVLISISSTHATSIDEIKARGYMKVGISLGGPPMGGRDGRNQPVGYDVDFANRLADLLGVELRITDVYGDARVSLLISQQLDMVIANLTATEQRAKVIDFSHAYFRTGLKIITQKNSDIKKLEDLSGKKVTVGRGTSGAIFLTENVPEAELIYTDNFAPNGVLLLRQRRVDAGIEDASLIDFLARDIKSLQVMEGTFVSGDIAIGIKKGQPQLLEWLNHYIADYISSGDYHKYYKKWWGDQSIAPDIAKK